MMNRENVIKFSKPKFYLEFTVYDENENDNSVWLEVSCGEDIESYMKDYFNENWDQLFFNKVPNTSDISYATIDGMGIDAKDGDCELQARVPSRGSFHNFARIKFDMKTLEEDNAQKINKIREIIS